MKLSFEELEKLADDHENKVENREGIPNHAESFICGYLACRKREVRELEKQLNADWSKYRSAEIESLRARLEIAVEILKGTVVPNEKKSAWVSARDLFLSKLNSPEPVEREKETRLEAHSKEALEKHKCQGCSSCKGVVVKDGDLR